MKCPTCSINLVMTDRNGVEIDYCPECRGVWLDRGELDKIIERSTQNSRPAEPTRIPQDRYYSEHDSKHYGYKKKKRDSFLGDLFDF
ncbi:zf-TFIIB domain-containing protein [Pedobacter flavus]|uniref:Zf-TFIIB domain-containing protein n=1 Tax=Pedobacter flavus TaxID=3113906 RepID=A0ABU7H228_9SPHI|nr:zf-TFIIB domain-containing protein [Pedobacter sp. VNH31]MEE1885371.1 zf-TFIIB domain-containing protein [Pedobacter sp. VNH31]